MTFSFIGIIGDVHAEHERLEAAINFMHEANVQKILCVGDIVDGAGDVEKCCRLLSDANVEVVRGNHDRWFTQEVMRDLPNATPSNTLSEWANSYISWLPSTRSFQTVAGNLLLCHGLEENDMQCLTPDDYGYALQFNDELNSLISQRKFKFVVGGHTHRRMVRQFDNLVVINAGTLYRSHSSCIALADFQSKQVYFHNFAGSAVEDANMIVALPIP